MSCSSASAFSCASRCAASLARTASAASSLRSEISSVTADRRSSLFSLIARCSDRFSIVRCWERTAESTRAIPPSALVPSAICSSIAMSEVIPEFW